MKYTKKIKNMGISNKDFKILNTLNSCGESSILPLATKIKMPRTTVSFRLQKLFKKEWVEKIKVKNHPEWRVSNNFKGLILGELVSKEFMVTHYSGAINIEKVFADMLKNKSEERIYFIEPNQQIKKFISDTNSGFFTDVINLLKLKKHISEGVSSEKNLEILNGYNKKMLKNMISKMSIIYVIPDKYLSFDDNIIIHKNFVYLFNFYKNSVTKIESESFAKSIKSIIIALQNFGKKIDLNQYIREILAKNQHS